MENQMVAHPHGVEAVPLGHMRATDQEVARSVLAEVRQ
jgi:hypothetical protein